MLLEPHLAVAGRRPVAAGTAADPAPPAGPAGADSAATAAMLDPAAPLETYTHTGHLTHYMFGRPLVPNNSRRARRKVNQIRNSNLEAHLAVVSRRPVAAGTAADSAPPAAPVVLDSAATAAMLDLAAPLDTFLPFDPVRV
jgi:hypothetical protein